MPQRPGPGSPHHLRSKRAKPSTLTGCHLTSRKEFHCNDSLSFPIYFWYSLHCNDSLSFPICFWYSLHSNDPQLSHILLVLHSNDQASVRLALVFHGKSDTGSNRNSGIDDSVSSVFVLVVLPMNSKLRMEDPMMVTKVSVASGMYVIEASVAVEVVEVLETFLSSCCSATSSCPWWLSWRPVRMASQSGCL
jgi:hypothetical protein